jgi:hypothetical protein
MPFAEAKVTSANDILSSLAAANDIVAIPMVILNDRTFTFTI